LFVCAVLNLENVVTVCPECHSTKIRYFGTGTQKLEQEINKLFPEASTIRMDIDTVTKKNSHEEISCSNFCVPVPKYLIFVLWHSGQTVTTFSSYPQ